MCWATTNWITATGFDPPQQIEHDRAAGDPQGCRDLHYGRDSPASDGKSSV